MWSYYGYDGLGSVRQVYDSLGAVGYATSYAPYGDPFEQYGNLTTSLGFTGEYIDPTGLLFLRARYYNSGIGTFLTKDPAEGFLGGESIRWNGYNYVGANPINYTDPSGRCWGCVFALVGGIAGGALAGIYAHELFKMAENGDCGCDLRRWAKNTDYYDFVNQMIGMGITMGAVMGAISSGDPLAVAAAGVYMGSASALNALSKPGGWSNKCNQLQYILGLIGMALSLAAFAGTSLPPPLGGVIGVGNGVAAATRSTAVVAAFESVGVAGGLLSGTSILFSASSSSDGSPIQPPTDRSELRRNMENAGIEPPSEFENPQAHHNLPWTFKDWFARRGLNVNEARFGRWVNGAPKGPHQSWSRLYEGEWEVFIESLPDATQQQVFDKLVELLASGRFPSDY